MLGRIVGGRPDVDIKTAREVFGDRSRGEPVHNSRSWATRRRPRAYVALKRLGYTSAWAVAARSSSRVPAVRGTRTTQERLPRDVTRRRGSWTRATPSSPWTAIRSCSPDDIAPLLAGKKPGDKVTLTIVPKGSDAEQGRDGHADESDDGRTIIGFVPINGGVHADVGYSSR